MWSCCSELLLRLVPGWVSTYVDACAAQWAASCASCLVQRMHAVLTALNAKACGAWAAAECCVRHLARRQPPTGHHLGKPLCTCVRWGSTLQVTCCPLGTTRG